MTIMGMFQWINQHRQKLVLTVSIALLMASAQTGPSASAEADLICAAAPFRALDFRLGRFKGVTESGQFAGTTEVMRDAEGCALIEHWYGALGGNGVGLFFFNRSTGKWHFSYINADGETLQLIGQADAQGITFSGENAFYALKGLHQIRWEQAPDGAVRQVWHVTPDQGKTWQPVVNMLLAPTHNKAANQPH